MSGRRLMIGLLAFTTVFGAALVWFQFFAYYERQRGVGALTIAGETVPIAGYDGIDAATSPLKLRGCFRIDPASVAALAPAADATPLVAPFWFRCFDARARWCCLTPTATRASTTLASWVGRRSSVFAITMSLIWNGAWSGSATAPGSDYRAGRHLQHAR